jgi:phage-related minor tail protein
MSLAFASNIFQSITVKAIVATSILFDGNGPSAGIFGPIMDKIASLARDLWGVLVGLIVIAATLAMIISVLRGTGGMLIGGSKETTVAVVGIVGVVLLVVVAFVAIPQLANLLKSLTPAAPF